MGMYHHQIQIQITIQEGGFHLIQEGAAVAMLGADHRQQDFRVVLNERLIISISFYKDIIKCFFIHYFLLY